MAEVNVIAPDGTPGTLPEEELQAALADGFQLPGGTAPAAVEAPDEVEVRAPDGTVGTVARSELAAALDDGFEETAQDRYRTTGQKLATAAEGFGRGATMGISDAVQTYGAGIGTALGNMLADKALPEAPRATEQGIDAPLAEPVDRPLFDKSAQIEAGQDIAGRREANKALAVGSEIAGALAPAALSGGVGSAGALARMTPAGQIANLATKMGTMLSARATSAVGRIGALALTGAAEAAVDNATRTVVGDLAAGNVDITAERALEAAWDGAKWGGLVGGGLGAVAEGAQAAGRAVSGLAGKLPSVEDFASGRAFKAALGRTNKKGVDAAARFGGPEAVGKTLLDEGVVTAGASLEDIAERSGTLRQSIGAELGAAVKQADELAPPGSAVRPTGAGLKAALEDNVLSKLSSGTFSEGTEATVRSKFKRLFERLDGDGPLSFEDINGIRKELDDELANWNSLTAEKGPLKAYRDARRVMEDYYLTTAEQAAEAAGRPGFADGVRNLKRRFSHVALAEDLANEAIASKLSNRFMSPSDYGMGAAAAVVTGGTSLGALASGAAASQANRLIRERGNQVVAATLYRLARGAVKQEQAVEGAVQSTVRSLSLPTAAISAAARAAVPSAESMQRMVAQAQALQDPESPESHQLEAHTLQLASESPEFADAMKSAVMRKASMIVQKMGPSTDPSDPLARQPMPVDRVTKSRNERFLRAVQNPSAALDRLASGHGSPEDLAVVRELTPQIHKRYVDGVMAQIVGSKQPLTMAQRQRLLFALGTPVVREQTPEFVRFYTNLLAGRGQEGQQQQEQAPAGLPESRKPTAPSKELKVDQRWANRGDAITGGIGE